MIQENQQGYEDEGLGAGTHGERSEESAQSYRPAYEIVAERLLTYLAGANLQPGDRLPTEVTLAGMLGVSRSVMREAIKTLTATGLIHAQKGRGLFMAEGRPPFLRPVRVPSLPVELEHMHDLFEYRLCIEPQCAAIAAERITVQELETLHEMVRQHWLGAEQQDTELFHNADRAFHDIIAKATHNAFLISAATSVQNLQDWAMSITINYPPGSLIQAVTQHETILEMIEGRKPEAASQAMRLHIETVIHAYRRESSKRVME